MALRAGARSHSPSTRVLGRHTCCAGDGLLQSDGYRTGQMLGADWAVGRCRAARRLWEDGMMGAVWGYEKGRGRI